MRTILLALLISINLTLDSANAHQATHAETPKVIASDDAQVMYLGNEALLVTNQGVKVLFDPFFHNHYGQYQLVPDDIRRKIFAGEAPFDGITAIFISHAHGDHFSEQDTLDYLGKFDDVKLYAPQQAVKRILGLNPASEMLKRISSVALDFGDKPVRLTSKGLVVEAVRIPHAGWPGRAEIENLIFRVSLAHPDKPAKPQTVMHMGDADPDPTHYQPFTSHWQKRKTDTAFPPYWFYFSKEGNDILNSILNVDKTIGVHVPVKAPQPLINSGKDYFHTPGEIRSLTNPNP